MLSAVAEDSWYRRALPILEAIAGLEGDVPIISLGDLGGRAGLTPDEVDLELRRLISAGYALGAVQGFLTGGDKTSWIYEGVGLAERGARAVGKWPADDAYDALLQILDRRIADEGTDPTTKTRLQRMRDTMVEIGQGVAGSVLAALLKSGLGLP